MTTAEWITASLVFIIAAILAVVSIRSFQNKGLLFNNAYIYASKEESIGLSLLLHKDKLFLLEITFKKIPRDIARL